MTLSLWGRRWWAACLRGSGRSISMPTHRSLSRLLARSHALPHALMGCVVQMMYYEAQATRFPLVMTLNISTVSEVDAYSAFSADVPPPSSFVPPAFCHLASS